MDDIKSKLMILKDRLIEIYYGLAYKQVQVMIYITIVIIAILIAYLIYKIGKQGVIGKLYTNTREKTQKAIENSMKNSTRQGFNYEAIDIYLTKYGFKFFFKWIDPIAYVAIKIILALAFSVIFASIEMITIPLGAFIGYKALDIIVKLSDKGDNEEMMDDIRVVLNTLRLQTMAGVYITNAISECYVMVKNKRLKRALLELSGDIAGRDDMRIALAKFNGKFDNEHIDALCVIINQLMDTGQASEMLKDFSVQIDSIQAALIIKEEQQIRSQTLMCQILIFIAITAMMIYSFTSALPQGDLFAL